MADDCPPGELHCPSVDLPQRAEQLRAWRTTDAAALFSAFSDPRVQQYSWPHERSYTADDAQDYLLQQEQGRQAGLEVQWAIVDRTHDRLAGGVSLYEVEQDVGRASVGYWLAVHARRQGLATASVIAVADWAFETLGLARLQLTCGPDNHASQAVAARCGFTREGLLRSHMPFKGTRRDTVVFSLLRHEHPARTSHAGGQLPPHDRAAV